jgi:hypothetical protein
VTSLPTVRVAPRTLALEAAIVGLLALTLSCWFAGRPHGLPASIPAALLVVAMGARLRASLRRPWPRPSGETVACVGVAVLFRLPALLHPWAWVNKEGAYAAFVTLQILRGARPASPFTEGASYQGTLKSQIAALLAVLTRAQDQAGLLLVTSLLLHLVFLVATMALARRIAGRTAARGAGLYLALSPRFFTVFMLTCVGQYADVLALGGVALVLLARILDDSRTGADARGSYFAMGLLLGAAFWQQPVAISYVLVTVVALALRRATWRDPWVLAVAVGAVIGALPLLLWNVANHWGTATLVGREPGTLRLQLEELPHLVKRTFTISFPILAGVSPELPWAEGALPRAIAVLLIPGALAAYLAIHGREAARALRREPRAALLPALLAILCVLVFWATSSGRVYWRPRYLLPLMGGLAIAVGCLFARAAARSRPVAAAALAVLLAVNVAGTWPRLAESEELADYYRRIVRSLEDKGIATGYATFSISAPVTMFTSERILLSPRLDPLPSFEPERHVRRVETEGPDAYVLPPEDDWRAFAARLESLGVRFQLDREPVAVFYGLSRRVRLEEVADFRTTPAAADPGAD